MGDVVNLNKFRKTKAKGDKTQKAAENRSRFGRTKGEKAQDKSDEDKARTEHKGHELDHDPDDPAPNNQDPSDKEPA